MANSRCLLAVLTLMIVPTTNTLTFFLLLSLILDQKTTSALPMPLPPAYPSTTTRFLHSVEHPHSIEHSHHLLGIKFASPNPWISVAINAIELLLSAAAVGATLWQGHKMFKSRRRGSDDSRPESADTVGPTPPPVPLTPRNTIATAAAHSDGDTRPTTPPPAYSSAAPPTTSTT